MRPIFLTFEEMKLKRLYLVLLSILIGSTISIPANAQADTSRKVLQLTGVVVDADSLFTLPYVAIVIRNTTRGVYSNINGYYSMVVQEKDTIDFYSLGYHRASYVLPDTFQVSNQLNLLQSMRVDTIFLREAVIYPWPSREEFKAAFLALEVPADDLERAKANMARAELVQNAQSVARDGGMIYNSTMNQQAARSASKGQYPSNNLLNPVAWAKFLQSLNNGELKRQ
jgi:CarboxypepD_reg-like domain